MIADTQRPHLLARTCASCRLLDGDHTDDCPASAAVESMMDTDRDYFRRHPGARSYARPVMPGDLGLADLDGIRVLGDGLMTVTRVAEGVRRKRFPGTEITSPTPGAIKWFWTLGGGA